MKTKKSSKRFSVPLAILVSLLGSIALNATMAFQTDSVAYSNSTVSVLIFILSAIVLQKVYDTSDFQDKRGVVLSLLFSALFSLALLTGKQCHTVENCNFLSLSFWCYAVFLTLYFGGIILWLLQYLKQSQRKRNLQGEKWNWKKFLLNWGLLFLCWIPVFLAFYPGAFVYDAQDEFIQVASREFTTHHPLLHVLLLGGAVCFGNKFFDSYNLGIAIYTIFQMILFSGILTGSIFFLSSHFMGTEKQKRTLQIGITLFYGFFPVFPLYAVCSSKDTLFHGFFLMLLLFLLETAWQKEGEKRKAALTVGLVCSSVGMLLLRRNAVYAYVVCLLILLGVCLWKKNRNSRRILFYMLLSLCIYQGMNSGLIKICHATNEENQEKLTVPIQQLARTYQYSPEVFTEKDRFVLFRYLKEEDLPAYDADLSDLLKANFNNAEYQKDPKSFRQLWVKMGVKKPLTYLNAWLMTSYGYWYPDTVNNVYGGQQRFTFQYGESSYFGFETEPPGVRNSKFPWLEEQYRKLSLELTQQKMPVVSMLFSQGFLFWVFAFLFLNICYRKEWNCLLPMGLLFLVWATFLLGPTFLPRYGLILWLIVPLECLLLITGTNDIS